MDRHSEWMLDETANIAAFYAERARVMWARLDDGLLYHPKMFQAGEQLGENGALIAQACYTLALLYSVKYLTDGHLTTAVVQRLFRVYAPTLDPLAIAKALELATMFDVVADGWQIHDFHDYNEASAQIRARRQDRHLSRSKNGRES